MSGICYKSQVDLCRFNKKFQDWGPNNDIISGHVFVGVPF